MFRRKRTDGGWQEVTSTEGRTIKALGLLPKDTATVDEIDKMFARLAIAVLAAVSPVFAQITTYQAESAQLSGVTVGTSVAGFTGIKLSQASRIPF